MRGAMIFVLLLAVTAPAGAAESGPSFVRHVAPVLSRLGCNSGSCHGAVQGKNGFRLSLFSADPALDYEQIVRGEGGRRLNHLAPELSLLLVKATGQAAHGGGVVTRPDTPQYAILRDWIAAGARLDAVDEGRVVELRVEPQEQTVAPGDAYPLRVHATFATGQVEEVSHLCTFETRSAEVATVDASGEVQAAGVGDTAIIVRYRAEPALSMVVVARPEDPASRAALEAATPRNFVDEKVLAKLRRLNLPPSELADDATFLRRARLDVTAQLPTPQEVRDFLADADPHKRSKKIDQLLAEPGYAALWTLKFCDLLNATDFGVYADGLAEHYEAPRFQAWIRARLEENTPYDELAERILTATSREGRTLAEWSEEVIALQEGYTTPRKDLEIYAGRKTLDAYWQRKEAVGVPGALQVAHAFLGLRLDCAQCHRHPHDVWRQDDLLSFANFFTRVRTVGFRGDNEKKYPEDAALFKKLTEEGKALQEQAKKLKEELNNRQGEEKEKLQQEIRDLERRGKAFADEVPKRILHGQVFHLADADAAKQFASVTSPLGTQSSQELRLLGQSEPLQLADDEDPRGKVVEWLRRPDNPYFAKAIVNRVWAHYFGRGLVDPPDDLSSFNPPTHPQLLEELCQGFLENHYDLKWLHRAILNSRTYQQSSRATVANAGDRANYATFALRRLPAETLLDALNQATGMTDNLDMKYYHWPEDLRTVEIPYMPSNSFVRFMLEQFGRPARNSAVQCDCERQSDASMLQVLSFANHPRVWQKVADPAGRVSKVMQQSGDERQHIEELFLATVSRLPESSEMDSCLAFLQEAESPEKGYQAVLWSLLNTKEFVLQH